MKRKHKNTSGQFFATVIIVLLVIMVFSDANAQFMFSSDTPFEVDSGATAKEKDIIYREPGFHSFYLKGSDLGVPDGVNIDAFAVCPEGDIVSFDIPTEVGGNSFAERDLVLHNGGMLSKILDGAAIGIPAGVDIDAVTRLQDGSFLFSVDVPTTLGSITCNPNDIVQYREGVFNIFFNGTAQGIPENANIDAIWVGVSAELLFSLDIPAELNGLSVKETDVILWTEGNFYLYSSALTEYLPEGTGADVDGLRLVADYDADGVLDDEDNCPIIPNGPDLGTCAVGSDFEGATCMSDADCTIGCSSNGQCSKGQEDRDADGFGDVCDISEDIRWLVREYYLDILDREPDPDGWNYWIGEIERIRELGVYVGEGFQAEARLFFNSQEYLDKGKTDSEFVIDLYQTFLQRVPDSSGLTYWISQLSCLTRNMLITQFAYSNEFIMYIENIFATDMTRPENNMVNDFYRGFLNRFPDDVGYNSWLQQMRQAQCSSPQSVQDLSYQLSLLFIQSGEYAGRNRNNTEYVEDLYNAILRRGADCGGFQAWVNNLNSGMTRVQVLQAFTASTEFQARVDAVIAAGCILP